MSIRTRMSMFIMLIIALLTVAISIPNQANAAGVTTDYQWSGWVRCQFSTPWTYDNVRWRIDFRHNSAGQRDARAITYMDTQGSTAFRTEGVSERWPSGSTISQTSRTGLNATNSTWYVGNAMTWVGINNAANVSEYLVLDDGDVCSITHSF